MNNQLSKRLADKAFEGLCPELAGTCVIGRNPTAQGMSE